VPICSKIGSFNSNYCVPKINGQEENIMTPAGLDWQRHKHNVSKAVPPLSDDWLQR